MEGWIKLHRKITEWDWYDDANTFRLFIHLLLLANSKDANWRGENIRRGELITSVAHLSEDLKLTTKQIRLSLEKLKKTSEIGTERANNATMITIYKYECYQGSDKIEGQTNGQPKDKPRANRGQTEGNKQEGKEIEEGKELNKREDIFKEDILTYINTYPKEMLKDFFDYWSEANKSKTKMRFEMQPTWDIKKRLATWAKNDKGFKQPQKGVTEDDMRRIFENKKNKLLNAGN